MSGVYKCAGCGEGDGESEDDWVVDFWDESAPEGQQHKMAHVHCAEARGWVRA